jgi:hypothetical protein
MNRRTAPRSWLRAPSLAAGLALASGCGAGSTGQDVPVVVAPVVTSTAPSPSVPSAGAAELSPKASVAAVAVDGSWCLIDPRGHQVGARRFAWARPFANGWAAVNAGGTVGWQGHVEGGKWGFVDRAGRVVMEPAFDDVGTLAEGRVAFNLGGAVDRYGFVVGGKWGMLAQDGTTVVAPKYDGLRAMHEGRAAFNVGGARGTWGDVWSGAWGFVDRDGREVVPPRFGSVGDYSQGLVTARTRRTPLDPSGPWPPVTPCPGEGCDKLGYLDASGRWALPEAYQEAGPFLDGLARVYDGGAYFYIDQRGKPATGRYRSIGDFARDVAPADLSPRGRGVVTKGGKVLCSDLLAVEHFAGGRLAVERDSGWGFVDAGCHERVPARYQDVEDFSEGMAAVRTGGLPRENAGDALGGRWGFVDAEGRVVVEPKYARVRSFQGGLAAVAVLPVELATRVLDRPSDEGTRPDVEEALRWGFIDRSGREVIAPRYERSIDFAAP